MNDKFTFIDLFAGIGGFRIALENLGGKCVFSSEYNKFSRLTYQANFGEEPQGDITKIPESEIPDHDILAAGFPCQPFSAEGVVVRNYLGRPSGFLDETQGTMFFEIARIIKAKRPEAIILENVKNLVHHDNGRTLTTIKNTLQSLGYNVFWDIIDASAFVPQHRERIIIVGFRKDLYPSLNFKFKEPQKRNTKIADILDSNVDEKYTLSDNFWDYIQEHARKQKELKHGFGYGLMDPEDRITPTLVAHYAKGGYEILIKQKDKNPRKLTPDECKRLMGFPENFVIPVSDTQAYKQFGNAVVPAVIEHVARQVIEKIEVIQ
jgi:DNA (cytosine-5)-methyltransferase 1